MNRNKHTLKYMKEHCKKRCMERYGVELTNSMMKKITNKIMNGDCLCSVGQVFFVTLDSNRFRVAFDKSTQRIITFLPNQQLGGK